jgi:phosphoglycolate phosphatase-like HAD superfamily hydrolase
MILEPGLFELLDTVRAIGLKRAIFTNRTNSVDMVVEHFGLRPYFDLFLSASDVRPKPHPEGMHRIIETWRMDPERMAYIGDTNLDAMAASDAGVPFWAYKQELPGAEMLVTDFYALRAGFLKERRSCLP